MAYYCLCNIDSITRVSDEEDLTQQVPIEVCLDIATKMQCIKTGARQILQDGHEHFGRNVDIHQCPKCKNIITKD